MAQRQALAREIGAPSQDFGFCVERPITNIRDMRVGTVFTQLYLYCARAWRPRHGRVNHEDRRHRGTGLIGSKAVAILRQRGHEVVAASPKSGINTITGEGLKAAVAGAQVVIDL